MIMFSTFVCQEIYRFHYITVFSAVQEKQAEKENFFPASVQFPEHAANLFCCSVFPLALPAKN